mmetsp:Transcript_16811/g.30140  ORF Transcript_16811/g.30140 Transcript_16811/m.30140 type:complete len:499 (+) Transcript_16811:1631-3127(+)
MLVISLVISVRIAVHHLGVGLRSEPERGRLRVALQSLQLGQRHAVLHHRLRRGGRVLVEGHPCPHSQEAVHGQASRVACRAPRRERVVGSRAVVAEDLRGVGSDEECSVVVELFGGKQGLFGQHFEVFGREEVCGGDGLLHALAHDHEPVVEQRHGGGALGGQVVELDGELLLDLRNQRLVSGHQHWHCDRVVLGLGQQVRRDGLGVGGLVGEHQELAGPGQHVNGALARHQLLRSGHPLVSRAHDGVARGHVARTVRQSGDGLGPADAQEEVSLRDVRCCLGDLRGPRRCYPYFSHAGTTGSDCRHEDGRREGKAAAGGVAAAALDGRDLLPGVAAGDCRFEVADGQPLRIGEVLDSLGGLEEHVLLLFRDVVESLFHVLSRQDVRLPVFQVAEAHGVLQQRLLAVRLHILNDDRGLLSHLRVDDVAVLGQVVARQAAQLHLLHMYSFSWYKRLSRSPGLSFVFSFFLFPPASVGIRRSFPLMPFALSPILVRARTY